MYSNNFSSLKDSLSKLYKIELQLTTSRAIFEGFSSNQANPKSFFLQIKYTK